MKNLDKHMLHCTFVSRYLNVEKVREVEEISTVKECETSCWMNGVKAVFFRHKRQQSNEMKQNKICKRK